MSSRPLHVQLADTMRERIEAGELAVGSAFPSESLLVEQFGASRGTVRQALGTLRREGYIVGGRGRAPVVRQPPAGQPFETFLSFTAWAEQLGRTPGQRTLEVARRAASPAAATALDLPVDTPVVDVLRLRLLDGEPVMLERSTFPLAVGMLLFELDLDAGSIHAGLATRGVELHSAGHTIDAVAASSVDADLLEVSVGSPLLREQRRACDGDERPVEYADDRYRPDRATFTIANTRMASSAVVRRLRPPSDPPLPPRPPQPPQPPQPRRGEST